MVFGKDIRDRELPLCVINDPRSYISNMRPYTKSSTYTTRDAQVKKMIGVADFETLEAEDLFTNLCSTCSRTDQGENNDDARAYSHSCQRCHLTLTLAEMY